MRFYWICTLLLAGCLTVSADDIFMIQRDRYVKCAPIYQSWSQTSDFRFSQVSAPVYLYLPVGRNVGLSVQSAFAQASGTDLTSLSGITDVQLGCSWQLENMGTVLNFGVNVPSGSRVLTQEEFDTWYHLSWPYYNFRVPSFGQGLNLSGGATWAHPLSEKFVVGLGGAYHYKGAYVPFEEMVYEYDPGDEMIVTAGLDYRTGEVSTLSFDFIYTGYQVDKVGGEEHFASGSKMIVSALYKQYLGYDELQILARYRSKDKNSAAISYGIDLVPEEEKTIPDYLELLGMYKYQIDPLTSIGFIAEGRFFQETSRFPDVKIYGGGVMPEYRIDERFSLFGRAKYFLGVTSRGPDFSGVEIGAGGTVRF